MKEFMFFSKQDKKAIIFLSFLIVILVLINVLCRSNSTSKFQLKVNTLVEDVNADTLKDTVRLRICKFNDTINANKIKQKAVKVFKTKLKKESKTNNKILVELNSADTTELMKLKGIGATFSKRIVKYRSLLGGYIATSQILEVYGFTQQMYDDIEANITVDTLLVKKIDLNTAEFKELLRHPYIDYETTKQIVNGRPYLSIDEFMKKGIVSNIVAGYLTLDSEEKTLDF